MCRVYFLSWFWYFCALKQMLPDRKILKKLITYGSAFLLLLCGRNLMFLFIANQYYLEDSDSKSCVYLTCWGASDKSRTFKYGQNLWYHHTLNWTFLAYMIPALYQMPLSIWNTNNNRIKFTTKRITSLKIWKSKTRRFCCKSVQSVGQKIIESKW